MHLQNLEQQLISVRQDDIMSNSYSHGYQFSQLTKLWQYIMQNSCLLSVTAETPNVLTSNMRWFNFSISRCEDSGHVYYVVTYLKEKF